MSLEAVIDSDPEVYSPCATISGWTEFCRFVNGLPGVPVLKQLVQHGLTDDLDALANDLGIAIVQAGEENADIASGLVRLLQRKGNGQVLIVEE